MINEPNLDQCVIISILNYIFLKDITFIFFRINISHYKTCKIHILFKQKILNQNKEILLNLLKELYIKVNGQLIKDKDMENKSGQTVQYMKEIG